jgi:hypothetical protein
VSSTPSVTHWLGGLQAGDREAARELWERYFERLVRPTVERKLRLIRRIWTGEEDQ